MFYANGPKIVLTRLCLAVCKPTKIYFLSLNDIFNNQLSSMILHSIPDLWTSPLSDFIAILQQNGGGSRLLTSHITLLLDILTVLPEEVYVL